MSTWDTTCLGPNPDETCIARWMAGYILPADLCEGCTRRLMDVLSVAEPWAQFHPNWYRRAGVETAIPRSGDQRD